MFWQYAARDADGTPITGTISADNQTAARDALKAQGIQPHLLTQRVEKRQLTESAKRARIAFLRGYASLTQAGMKKEEVVRFLLDAVRVGQGDQVVKVLGKALSGMRRDVSRAGATIGEAMLNQPALFTSVDAAIADTAFQAGTLPETLQEHADQLESDLDFQSEMRGSLMSPIIALIVGALIFPFIAGTLAPVLEQLYEAFHITPPPSFAQLAAVGYAAHTPWLWLSYVAVTVGFWYAWRTGRIRPLLRHLPLLGSIMRARATEQAARTLGQAYKAGRNPAVACSFAASTIDDPELEKAFLDCSDALRRGRVATIAEAMSEHRDVFDPLFIQYITMARESRIPEMCGHVSNNARRQIKDAVQRLPIFVSNGSTLAVGLFVGLMAYYIYTAISYAVGHINQPDVSPLVNPPR